MIKLYDSKTCPWARKSRVVMLEKGLRWEPVYVDLANREQKRPEFLAINPLGKVPTLVDDGIAVCDSTIINEYLEDKYPTPPLLPRDPALRARARWFEDYADTQFQPSLAKITQNLRKPEAERDQARMKEGEAEMAKHLSYLDQQLEGREFLAGQFSVGDIAYWSHLDSAERAGYKVPAEFKNFNAWWRRMKARPSFPASWPN